jgi:hypothetical protein
MTPETLRQILSFSMVASAVALVGCGGAAVPRDQLTLAQAAVKGAEVGGANEEPKAALHLKLAREQISKANALIADGENEDAARMIARAQADADLSLALAKQAAARRDTQDAKEQIDQIKENIIK